MSTFSAVCACPHCSHWGVHLLPGVVRRPTGEVQHREDGVTKVITMAKFAERECTQCRFRWIEFLWLDGETEEYETETVMSFTGRIKNVIAFGI